MNLKLWFVGLAFVAGVGIAHATVTRYYPPTAYPVGGPLIRLARDQACEAGPCEYGSLAVREDDAITVDCRGACDVALVCRFPNMRDVPMWNAQPSDGVQYAVLTQDCESAWFVIRSCVGTTTSPACLVTGWLVKRWY